MKKILCLLVYSLPSFGAIALVAHAKASGANPAVTAGIDTTGANFCVAMIDITSATLGTITDSNSNTWTALPSPIGATALVGQMYYARNATVGVGHTFTYTQVAQNPAIFVACFSGVMTASNPLDVSVQDERQLPGGSAATTYGPGSVTPSNANSLIVAGVATHDVGFGAPLSTIDSGFTVIDVTTLQGGLAYIVETTIVAKDPQWTTSNQAQLISGFNAVFSAPAGGVTPHNIVVGLQ